MAQDYRWIRVTENQLRYSWMITVCHIFRVFVTKMLCMLYMVLCVTTDKICAAHSSNLWNNHTYGTVQLQVHIRNLRLEGNPAAVWSNFSSVASSLDSPFTIRMRVTLLASPMSAQESLTQ